MNAFESVLPCCASEVDGLLGLDAMREDLWIRYLGSSTLGDSLPPNETQSAKDPASTAAGEKREALRIG